MNYKFILTALFCLPGIFFPKQAHANGLERQLYSLIISISEYPNQPSWPKVNSVQDVENIQYFIKKISSFNDIKILRDQVATKKNIINGLNEILKKCTSGDRVYLHFSGGGFQLQGDTVRQVFMPYDAPSVEDMTDAVMNDKAPDLVNTIVDRELIELIQKIRYKVGPNGQCFFTLDASRFGPKDSKPQSIIGRGGFLKISDAEAELSPFIMLTSCLDKEESYFIGDKEPLNRSFSTALKRYSQTLSIGKPMKFTELFEGVKKEMAVITSHQTPAIAGAINKNVFGGGYVNNISRGSNDNNIPASARLFILSIGINKYLLSQKFIFANCDDDAKLFTSTLRSAWPNGDETIKTWLLLDSIATKPAILNAINQIIAEAKDDDVFAFFFAGLTYELKNKNGRFEETWFYPHVSKPMDITIRKPGDENEILSLNQLKKLFDYLKCDKQLLFTEAGPSENFKREFVKSMIKTNPVITEIRKRNRVIIVPDKLGLDNVSCDGKAESHGPGLFFFSQLIQNNINIFDLFSEEDSRRSNVVFGYRNIQFKCRFKTQYINFFFEKEFVEDLQYYFTKDIPINENSTRGAGENEGDEKIKPLVIGKKYALIIGTDKFSSWTKLQNPVNDASSIADTLAVLFGFDTTLLINPTLRQIYNSLYAFRNILQENDQFLIYLAGHGYYDSTIFKDGFIVTSDSRALKADTFLNSYIPFHQLRTITDNYKAKQIIVLLDVCFSGAFDDSDESLGGNINYNLTGKLTDKTVGKKLQMTTRKYITAGSRTEEVGDDYNGEHSPFAYFLLEGLRRAAKDKKYLSSGMLYKFIQSYLEDTVPLQAGFGKDQEKSGSEFIFIVNN